MVRVAGAFFVRTWREIAGQRTIGWENKPDKVFGSLYVYIECASNLETSGAHSANFMGKVSAWEAPDE
jgi:hypothetical protein